MTRKAATLAQRIRRKLSRIDNNIVTRKDFARLGGYEQVGRAIRELVNKNELVRMGYGVYAKVGRCQKDDVSVESLTKEALSRLNVDVDGVTVQGRSNITFHVHNKITRKLSYLDERVNYHFHKGSNDYGQMLLTEKRMQQALSRKHQQDGQKSSREIDFFSSVADDEIQVDYSRGFKR